MATAASVEGKCSSARRGEADALVLRYRPLIRQIAGRVYGRVSMAVPVEDLVQIGSIALLEAARRYETAEGASFTTYASMRIRGAMLDELRRTATTSRGWRAQRRAIQAAREAVGGGEGAETEARVAEQAGLSVEQLRAAEQKQPPVQLVNLDSSYSDHSSAFADDSPDALEGLIAEERQAALAAEIARLPERHALVLQLFFHEEQTLAEIGDILGVCPARVCQIKRRALEQVRAGLKRRAAGRA